MGSLMNPQTRPPNLGTSSFHRDDAVNISQRLKALETSLFRELRNERNRKKGLAGCQQLVTLLFLLLGIVLGTRITQESLASPTLADPHSSLDSGLSSSALRFDRSRYSRLRPGQLSTGFQKSDQRLTTPHFQLSNLERHVRSSFPMEEEVVPLVSDEQDFRERRLCGARIGANVREGKSCFTRVC